MINLDKYKPGQIVTSMNKRVFTELWADVQSGAALKRWPDGKAAETKKERTEELRYRVICIIHEDYRDVFQWLLDENWGKMEVYMDKNNEVAFRVLENSSRKLMRARASHRQYYGR